MDSSIKPLGWGILGTGGIAHAFTNELRLNGMTVAAVGSRAPASAEHFATTYSIPRRHASYPGLVADPAVAVVYVATPHPHHRDNALLALRHGKHVLVEKPFTINARQAEEVVREGDK